MLGATLGDSNILSEMDRFRSISATARWHKDLAEMNLTTIANVFGGTSKLQSAIDKIRSGLLPQMEEMSATYAALGIETHSSNLTAFAQIPALIETRHKFSAFAGISETFGVDGFGYSEVYRSIMGEWHTTLDLPERHWRDKQYRADNYKEAGVDEGLIEAPTPVAMDLAIESGLISGEVRSENRTLFIIIGSTSVSISSENVSNDTHSAVGVIERELRHFISQKLQSSFGEKWFKQRVDGAIFAKAKQTRQQSLKV